MVAVVRSVRNNLVRGEEKGMGVMMKILPVHQFHQSTLHPPDVGVRMQFVSGTLSKQDVVSHPSCLLCFETSALLHLLLSASGTYFYCQENFALDSLLQAQFHAECMCALGSFPAHSNTQEKETKLNRQRVFTGNPHRVHTLGKDRDLKCDSVILS